MRTAKSPVATVLCKGMINLLFKKEKGELQNLDNGKQVKKRETFQIIRVHFLVSVCM